MTRLLIEDFELKFALETLPRHAQIFGQGGIKQAARLHERLGRNVSVLIQKERFKITGAVFRL